MHETCHIASSFPWFWQSKTCCKDHQQTPPSWTFFVLEQSLNLAWMNRSCTDVTTLVQEKLSHVLPVGPVTFHLAFRGWRVEWFGLCITHPSLFRILSRGFEIFAKRDKVPQMVPSFAEVVFVTSPKAFERASTSYSMACMWGFG
jgi:hypothetical protein